MLAKKTRRWLVTAAVVSFAFWPRFVDLDAIPDTQLARDYRREALTTVAMVRHPIERGFDAIMVQNFRFSDWREVPGSCAGSPAVPAAADVMVTLTAIGPWGIPLYRQNIHCGGSGWTRDADWMPPPPIPADPAAHSSGAPRQPLELPRQPG